MKSMRELILEALALRQDEDMAKATLIIDESIQPSSKLYREAYRVYHRLMPCFLHPEQVFAEEGVEFGREVVETVVAFNDSLVMNPGALFDLKLHEGHPNPALINDFVHIVTEAEV